MWYDGEIIQSFQDINHFAKYMSIKGNIVLLIRQKLSIGEYGIVEFNIPDNMFSVLLIDFNDSQFLMLNI